MFRQLLYFLITAFCILSLQSCSVLQWRSSDQEIYARFSSRDIPTSISYFEVDSLDLKVRVQAIKKDEVAFNLVFFHGSPSSLSAWNGYLQDTTLTKNANLYAIDRPGYGYSNFGEEMTSIDQQATIMSALLDDYHLQNVIAIGSSYGGPLAARLAVKNNNVKGVVMISPAIDPTNEKKIWQSKFTQWWITRWLCPTGYRVAGDEKTVHAKELAVLENDWSALNVPVIHIHGNIDDIVPYENINYSEKHFKNSTIITIPDTGHEIAWARPELIKPHILKLINQLSKKE